MASPFAGFLAGRLLTWVLPYRVRPILDITLQWRAPYDPTAIFSQAVVHDSAFAGLQSQIVLFVIINAVYGLFLQHRIREYIVLAPFDIANVYEKTFGGSSPTAQGTNPAFYNTP